MNIRRRIRHDERGQTATELALVLPVFCLLLFGVIQFGIVFNNYVTLTDATRVGARKAAVSRFESDPASASEQAVRKSAGGLDQSKLLVSVSATSWTHGADVTVEASYPYEINLLGFTAKSGRLTSTTTERVE
ncbi:MAG TPA: TadE/TadG family type IV pilus assembly protein [Gaiellaceae bacterium]|nr:TadE/TadG family type IV pilus assembly protein [Gaiellaceae bacterium]